MTSSCTAVYLPSDMQIQNGRYKASSEIDWWMLVVTTLEKMNLVKIGGAQILRHVKSWQTCSQMSKSVKLLPL